MTPEGFLEWELTQEGKHEFVAGQIIAMAGGTRAHFLIAKNVLVALDRRLRGGPCMALHEFKVAIPKGNWRYADVAVDCGPANMNDVAATGPRLIVEVESPSTNFLDELERIEDYQSVPTIEAIIVLSQSRARARLYRRGGDGFRHEDAAGLDAELNLEMFGFALTLAEIYEGVTFDAT
jgi:Uma2 family endonuclease